MKRNVIGESTDPQEGWPERKQRAADIPRPAQTETAVVPDHKHSDDENHPIYAADTDPDILEKGETSGPGKGELAPLDLARRSNASETTTAWVRRLRELLPAAVLERGDAVLAAVLRNPLFLRVQPFVAVVFRFFVALLSLPLKTLVNRVCATVLLVLFYLVFGSFGRIEAHDAAQHGQVGS